MKLPSHTHTNIYIYIYILMDNKIVTPLTWIGIYKRLNIQLI